jgi:molybdopterin adenylyltransferase
MGPMGPKVRRLREGFVPSFEVHYLLYSPVTPVTPVTPALLAVGILTISDRAAAGGYEDLGGPALAKAASKYGWHVQVEAIVPDELERIQSAVRAFSAQGCQVILTTGGTGVALRDVTPEAIRGIMRVELPGFGEVMRSESMKLTPNAILSRSLAAVVDQSLVIALPGKPQGALDCLSFVAGAIPHAAKVAAALPTSC